MKPRRVTPPGLCHGAHCHQPELLQILTFRTRGRPHRADCRSSVRRSNSVATSPVPIPTRRAATTAQSPSGLHRRSVETRLAPDHLLGRSWNAHRCAGDAVGRAQCGTRWTLRRRLRRRPTRPARIRPARSCRARSNSPPHQTPLRSIASRTEKRCARVASAPMVRSRFNSTDARHHDQPARASHR